MHFTRRLLDRRMTSLLLVMPWLVVVVATASCSKSDDDGAEIPTSASGEREGGAAGDAAQPDDAAANVQPRDAAAYDGGPLPVTCTTPPCARALVTTRALDVGIEGFCALLDDATVACWGANGDGQLGRGDEAGTPDSAMPARVVGLSEVEELSHTCARTSSGDVWCWGWAAYVQDDAVVYTGMREPTKIPVPRATAIGMGGLFVVGCADTDEGLFCWGANGNNQIASEGPANALPTKISLPDGGPIRSVAVGGATFVVRDDGSALSWGDRTLIGRVSSLTRDPYPSPIALGPISSIDTTHASACATVGGTGYCWGAIDYTGPTESVPSPLVHALPEPVVAPEPLVQIATTPPTSSQGDFTGGFTGDRAVRPQRWCAVGVSGAVYCWGLNSYGQAGDGTKEYAYQAVKVQGLPAPAVEVKTLPLSTCALLTTGKIHCWGNNFYGQLGTGVIKGGSLSPQEALLP